MGGWGSGGGRDAAKTSDYNKIDIVDLNRLGMIKIGGWPKLQWLINGSPAGDIRIYRQEPESIILKYRVRSQGGPWRDIEDKISMVRSRQNFGGWREWFICPSCCHRCRILYGGALFRCRRCRELTYPSQYEDYPNRLISRAQDTRMKLGGSAGMGEPFPQKPKWMRWKTYRALARKDEEADAVFWTELAQLDGLLDR